ncbi:MAG: MATE family efflux transporter [Terricaulis sp.]|nr:MATE family efflux transporter [Terricaulis sp.]
MAAASRPYIIDTLRLAGPVALARLGIITMALVDVIAVGQLAPAELPHQALGWAPTAVFLVAGIGLLQGVQVLAARAMGEGAPQGAGMALRRGLIIAIADGDHRRCGDGGLGRKPLPHLRHRARACRPFGGGDERARRLDPAASHLHRRHLLS